MPVTFQCILDTLGANNDFTFGTGNYYLALYAASSTSVNVDTTSYTDTTGDELPTASGYTIEGASAALSSGSPHYSADSPSAGLGKFYPMFDESGVTWTSAGFVTEFALLYNYVGKGSVFAVDFGTTHTPSGLNFTVLFPPNTDTEALIRFAA